MGLPIVGGNWNNTSNAGLAALNLNNARSNANNNIGFRPALLGSQNLCAHGHIDRVSKKRSFSPPLSRGNMDRTRRLVGGSPNAVAIPRKGRMHTVNGLWQRVISFDSLYAAYKRASAGKRYIPESLKFAENLEENLIAIQNELIWNQYTPQPLRQFIIHEPKERKISAPSFRDRVVHHSLCAAIEPAFERRFIQDSYACRKGLGTHASMARMLKLTRLAKRAWGTYWVLKCDVKKFFPSIDHHILKNILRRTIKDRNVLNLCDLIIDSFGADGKGLPIGALTSQLFANVYLDQLDHYCKEVMQEKKYCRYMDDFVILGESKAICQTIKQAIEGYLGASLELALNHRTGVWPGRHGVDFCGYRIWPTHVKSRKRTVKRAVKRLRAIAARYPSRESFTEARKILTSFMGYIRHCNGWHATQRALFRAAYHSRGEK